MKDLSQIQLRKSFSFVRQNRGTPLVESYGPRSGASNFFHCIPGILLIHFVVFRALFHYIVLPTIINRTVHELTHTVKRWSSWTDEQDTEGPAFS